MKKMNLVKSFSNEQKGAEKQKAKELKKKPKNCCNSSKISIKLREGEKMPRRKKKEVEPEEAKEEEKEEETEEDDSDEDW